MKKRTFVALLSSIALALSIYVIPTANAASDEEEVLQVLETWNIACNTSDLQLVTSLYWHSQKLTEFAPFKGGAFLIQGWEALSQWFKPFLEMPKGTIMSTMSNPQVTMITNDVAVSTCYQTLTMNPPLVEEQAVFHNRLTFVVQKIGDKWLIVHDHASMLPVD